MQYYRAWEREAFAKKILASSFLPPPPSFASSFFYTTGRRHQPARLPPPVPFPLRRPRARRRRGDFFYSRLFHSFLFSPPFSYPPMGTRSSRQDKWCYQGYFPVYIRRAQQPLSNIYYVLSMREYCVLSFLLLGFPPPISVFALRTAAGGRLAGATCYLAASEEHSTVYYICRKKLLATNCSYKNNGRRIHNTMTCLVYIEHFIFLSPPSPSFPRRHLCINRDFLDSGKHEREKRKGAKTPLIHLALL